jgi:hypothetical protein
MSITQVKGDGTPSPPLALPSAIPLQPLIECYKTDPHMTPRKWVQWACDCTERAMDVWRNHYPDDGRPDAAITAARRWVADPTEANRKAADAAAYAAARAADAAAHAADAAYAAADAAYAAADAADAADAARAAAYAAAYAAHSAEELWQAIHLMEIYHE